MKQDDGFTLLEAIVALGILAVIMAALLPVFISNLRMNAESERKSQAASAVEHVLDSWRTKKIDSVHFPSTGTQDTTVDIGGVTFNVRLTFCRVSTLCSTNSRMITAEAIVNNKVASSAETIFTEVNYATP